MANTDEAEPCPLCLEPLDITDLACQFCTCGYSMCLWCWHRIREDAVKQSLPARCPNCRTVYQKERVRMDTIDPDQLEDTRRRKKDDRKKSAVSQPKARRDLANVRVVQRNLVYAVGLAMEICYEDTLMGPEFFGAYGKMVKQMSVNRMGPYGSAVSRNGPTGSAYITFKRPEDAKRCIEAVNGITWGGKQVKACFGTTKYCNAFLKGVTCNNPECLYLHDIAEETDSYTKEETKSSKFINLTHAACMTKQTGPSPSSAAPPTGSAAYNKPQAASSSSLLPRQFSSSQVSDAAFGLAPSNSRADQDGCEVSGPSFAGSPPSSSWLAKAASSGQPQPSTSAAPGMPVPPAADEQEWPELAGSMTGVAGPQPSSSTEQPTAAPATAAEARHATGQQARHRDHNAIPTKPAKAEATARSPAKTSSSSPDHRHPTTPSPGNAHPHSPETPLSGQTTASASPAGTPPLAVHLQHHSPHAAHKQRRDASASSSDWTQGAAHQAEPQQPQQQQQQCMSQLPVASSSNVQQDPVVQLVSRRSSGQVPPPGFSGLVAAPCTSAAASTGARSKGPPPGFGAASASNGNGPPGFRSHSGSDGSGTSMHDQHAHHWSPSQDTQQQHWSSFQQSHSSPTAAGMQAHASSLHHSHSAGPPGYQTEPFAMPGLSNLQSMRQQPGTDHSLFSGSSNVPGFPASQFRQRSRFHFAQDQSAAMAPHFAGPSMFSSLVSPALQQHSNATPGQHGHDQLQYNSQHPDHQLFTSSSGLSGSSLFSGPPGMTKSNSVPHQHMAVGSPGRHVGNMTACMMGPPGFSGGPSSHEVAPGQALLRQLQMSQSPQRAQQQQLWQSQANGGAAGSGWDVCPTQPTSPFFDAAIVNASSAALREADPSSAAASPAQMPLHPSTASSQATATSSATTAGSGAVPDNVGDKAGDAGTPAAGLQTPPKNGKRRRGGRGTKGNAAHRSPQNRGRGRGGNISNPSSADMAMLQQQYDQAKSQLAISGAQLAQAQQKFQNIQI